MHSPDRALLAIDLDALAHNRAVIAAEAAGAEVAAVVKSDGYGLGAGPVSRRLYAEGTRSFFVARVAEGEALREAMKDRRAAIYVLDGLLPGTGDRMAAAGLIPVLSTLPQAHAALALAAARGRYEAALHVDTGMNRQGLTLEQVRALTSPPGGLGALNIPLLVSHLGSATDPGKVATRSSGPVSAKYAACFPTAGRAWPPRPERSSARSTAATWSAPASACMGAARRSGPTRVSRPWPPSPRRSSTFAI